MTAEWLVFWDAQRQLAGVLGIDAHGLPTTQLTQGPLDTIQSMVQDQAVRVILPAVDGLLYHVELPEANPKQVAALIPFAIEEQLASDIELQHVTFKPIGAQQYKVAVIEKARMQQLFEQFSAAGVAIRSVSLESDLLPPHPNQTLWVLRQGRLMIAEPGKAPLVLDVDPLEMIVPSLLTDAQQSAVLVVETPSPNRERLIELLERHYRHFSARESVQGLEMWLAPRVAQPETLNLADGEFAQHTSIPVTPRRLVPVLAMVACLLMLCLVNPISQAWKYHQAQQMALQGVQGLAQQWHVNIHSLTDLNTLVAKLNEQVKVQQQASQTGLLGGLSQLSPVMLNHPTYALTHLLLDKNALEFSVQVDNTEGLAALDGELTALGASRFISNFDSPKAHTYRMRVVP